jgi:hypothetical protein
MQQKTTKQYQQKSCQSMQPQTNGNKSNTTSLKSNGLKGVSNELQRFGKKSL